MIRASVKRLIRSIYVMRCGYCLVSEAETGAEMTYDHFQPQSKGGTDAKDNLVYACHASNEFKGEYFGDTADTRLLHPLEDDLSTHLRREADGLLTPLTVAGERYLRVLQLNRPPLVLYRHNQHRQQQAAARDEAINRRLDAIMAQVQRIETKLQRRRQ